MKSLENVPRVMPFRKRCKSFDFSCSFNNGFWTAIRKGSNISRVRLSFGAGIGLSHTSKWPMFLEMCLAGSVFSVGLLCSLQRLSTFHSVSPMYFSPHEHIPQHITQEGCGFLPLTLNSGFIFLVIHFIEILYRWFVNASNFLINCLEAFSFSSQYGNLTKTYGLLSSKRSG